VRWIQRSVQLWPGHLERLQAWVPEQGKHGLEAVRNDTRHDPERRLHSSRDVQVTQPSRVVSQHERRGRAIVLLLFFREVAKKAASPHAL
jgi:hypothetical protein